MVYSKFGNHWRARYTDGPRTKFWRGNYSSISKVCTVLVPDILLISLWYSGLVSFVLVYLMLAFGDEIRLNI